MPTRYLRLPDVAERTGLSLHTVRRWATQRRFPTARIGRAVLVPEDALDAWLVARTEAGRPAARRGR